MPRGGGVAASTFVEARAELYINDGQHGTDDAEADEVVAGEDGDDEAEEEERHQRAGAHHVNHHRVTDDDDDVTGDTQPFGDFHRNLLEEVLHAARLGGGDDNRRRNGDTQALQQQRAEVAKLNAAEIRLFGEIVRLVLEENGNGAHEDGQHLPGNRHGHGDGDTFLRILPALDDKNGGDDAGECRVRCHCRADVHPAQRQQLQRTADHDAGFQIAEGEANQSTGDQRAVRLPFIEYRAHAADEPDQSYPKNFHHNLLLRISHLPVSASHLRRAKWRAVAASSSPPAH